MTTKCTEGTFKSFDNAEIFYQTWQIENPHGTLVITHGLGEHSDRYDHVAKMFNSIHWNVIGWDLRGHGRSSGKRGHVESFSHFIKDLSHFLKIIQKDLHLPANPIVLFGHSMGGLVTLRYAVDNPMVNHNALAFSSPELGIAVKVPQWKEHFARLAYKWLPQVTLYNEIKYSDLTHDEEMLKTYPNDPLRHDKISPSIFLGMLENFDYVKSKAQVLTLPVLFQLAGKDKIVSTPDALEFYKKIPSTQKEVFVYEDLFHEIYNEIDREQVFMNAKGFFKKIGGQ